MTISKHDGYFIKPCDEADITAVMDFFAKEWSRGHYLATQRESVDYFFYNAERGNYNIIISIDKDSLNVIGILTYVPNTRFDSQIGSNNKFIWLCNWLVAHDRYKGMGLSLYSGLSVYEQAKALGTVGCNDRAAMLYKAMRYKTGTLRHFFLVNDGIRDFKIITGYVSNLGKGLGLSQNKGIELVRLDDKPGLTDLSEGLTEFIEGAKPKKTLDYMWNKYMGNPYREYYLYAIHANGRLHGVMALRTAESKGARALRIVDFIGDEANLAGIYDRLQQLCRAFDAEYIDMYCAGISEDCLASSGFQLNDGGRGLIVPDYFEPYLNDNIKIQYAYNIDGAKGQDKDCYIFRGDCDREHPGPIGGEEA